MGGRRVTTVNGGLLITFEGLERVGKTTQVLRLANWLQGLGLQVVTLREPGGTPLGEALRQVVLKAAGAESPMAEFLIFAAARAELYFSAVRPALQQNGVVIMDRFTDSSLAYQAFGRGTPREMVSAINHWVTEGRRPDLTFWLAGEELEGRGGDRLEDRDDAFFARVAAGYAELARQEPGRWKVIAARQPIDAVAAAVRAAVATRIGIE
ncbi:MAG: dTMP kinase [Thermaerobacter sp.]|nr:dTMP kinase [Thermaerobacter sp.]